MDDQKRWGKAKTIGALVENSMQKKVRALQKRFKAISRYMQNDYNLAQGILGALINAHH